MILLDIFRVIQQNKHLPAESPLPSHPASHPKVLYKPVSECPLRQGRADGSFVSQKKIKNLNKTSLIYIKHYSITKQVYKYLDFQNNPARASVAGFC